jgi:predicted RNase H-like HicB family nuclease
VPKKKIATFRAIVERDQHTGLLVGSIPDWPGAHSQGASPAELEDNLREVVTMLLEEGDPELESEVGGVQTILVR